VWIAALALKLTPAEWVEKIPVKIDENEVMGRDSLIMRTYDQQARGKIPDFRRGAINDEEASLKGPGGDDDSYHQV
jgi:hypothetical protein